MTDQDATRQKVDLPSGAVAELLVPGRLKAKHQQQITRAITQGATLRPGAAAVDLTDGVLAMMIQSWTVTGEDGEILPVPSVDLDSIGELELEDYEALLAIPAVGATVERIIRVRSERATPDDHADPMSPSVPSSVAKPRLRAESATSSGPAATTGKRTSPTRGSRTSTGGPRKK